jgi:hypothetical protein
MPTDADKCLLIGEDRKWMVAGQNDVNDPIRSRAKKHGRRQAIGSRGYRCRQHFRHIGHSNQGRSTPGTLCASQRGGLLPSSADSAQLRRVGLALIENDNTSPSLPWRRSFRRPEDSTAGRLCIPLRESRRLRDTPLTNHSDNHRYRTVQCLATGKPSQRTSATARVHADCRQRHVYGCSRARRHDLEVHKPRAKQNLVGTCRNRMHLLQADVDHSLASCLVALVCEYRGLHRHDH